MSIGPARDERGAITVWVVAGLIGFIVAIGLGVDFAGHARAEQEARGVAAEAARAGGQQLRLAGDTLLPDGAEAERAAENYVAASRFNGSARVTGTSIIEVQVSGEYRCLFLNIIGVTTLPVRATGTADVLSSGG